MARLHCALVTMLIVTSAASSLVSQGDSGPAVGNDLVRELFTGFHGDLVALKRGLDGIEALASTDPGNVEALAWRGAATLMWSSVSPDLSIAERIRLFQRATGDMDRAASLEPGNPRARLPRGVVLRLLTPGMPRFNNVPGLIENARADYQLLFDARKDALDRLSPHQLGELLEGLGDLYSRQDEPDEAEPYYRMLQSRLPGTEYAARAAEWLESRQPLPSNPSRCLGCHIDQ